MPVIFVPFRAKVLSAEYKSGVSSLVTYDAIWVGMGDLADYQN